MIIITMTVSRRCSFMHLPVECVLASGLQTELCCSQHTPGNSKTSIIQTSEWSLQVYTYNRYMSVFRQTLYSAPSTPQAIPKRALFKHPNGPCKFIHTTGTCQYLDKHYMLLPAHPRQFQNEHYSNIRMVPASLHIYNRYMSVFRQTL